MTSNFEKFLKNHPFFKVTFFSAIIVVLSSSLLIGCISSLHIGLKLWGISNEITYINSQSVQDDEDTSRYNELQGERIEIRNSSVLGYLMVQAGSHFTTSAIRFCYLSFVWPTASALILWLCVVLIRNEWQDYRKKVRMQEMTPSELADMYEARAKRLRDKAIFLHQTAMSYRKQAEELPEQGETKKQKEAYTSLYRAAGGRG